MLYEETLNFIHSLGRFSAEPTLERIRCVMNKLSNPQNKFKTIHIAGTNGKGSTSAFISSVLKEFGLKVGLFTSPFIIDFRERIQINGEYILKEDLSRLAQKVIDTDIKLTEFEFITAIAFLYFAEKDIDILVCETGLGGRFDATNIIENKIACVITKIGLDHTEILGDTIDKIAGEKCGILRDCPTVTTYNQPAMAISVIKEKAKMLIVSDLGEIKILSSDIGNTYIYKDKKYEIGLSGEYQIENSVLAIECLNALEFDIPYDIIFKGLKNAFIPARLEIISQKPLVVLDGAHNPDGAKALVNELSKQSEKVTAIIGMCKDKDYEQFLKETLAHCEFAVAVEIEGMPRSLTALQLKTTACKYCDCETAENYRSALEMAFRIADKGPIFIFGSLYLAAGIRNLLRSI